MCGGLCRRWRKRRWTQPPALGALGNEEGADAGTRRPGALGGSEGEAWSPVPCVSARERAEKRRQPRGRTGHCALKMGGCSGWAREGCLQEAALEGSVAQRHRWSLRAGLAGRAGWLRGQGVGAKTWLRGKAGLAYLAGPPSEVGHLVSETSWKKEPQVRWGRETEAAFREGTGK